MYFRIFLIFSFVLNSYPNQFQTKSQCNIYFSENISIGEVMNYEDALPWIIKNSGLNAFPISSEEILKGNLIRLAVPLKSERYKNYKLELVYKYINLENGKGEVGLTDFRFLNRKGTPFQLEELEKIVEDIEKLKKLTEEEKKIKEVLVKELDRKKVYFYNLRELDSSSDKFENEAYKTFNEINNLYAALREVTLVDDLSDSMKKVSVKFGEDTISFLARINKKSFLEFKSFMKLFFHESKFKPLSKIKAKYLEFRGFEPDLENNPIDLRQLKSFKKYDSYKQRMIAKVSALQFFDHFFSRLIGIGIISLITISSFYGKKILPFELQDLENLLKEQNEENKESISVDVIKNAFKEAYIEAQTDSLVNKESLDKFLSDFEVSLDTQDSNQKFKCEMNDGEFEVEPVDQ